MWVVLVESPNALSIPPLKLVMMVGTMTQINTKVKTLIIKLEMPLNPKIESTSHRIFRNPYSKA